MTGRVSSPNNEIDGVSNVVVDPLKRGVDEGCGGVAVGGLSAENASWAIASMAG